MAHARTHNNTTHTPLPPSIPYNNATFSRDSKPSSYSSLASSPPTLRLRHAQLAQEYRNAWHICTVLASPMYRLPTGLITPPLSQETQHTIEGKTMTYIPSPSRSPKSNTVVLGEQAAQTVCFLWFEPLAVLKQAAAGMAPFLRTEPDSAAKREFINWTREVLATTQLSTNVIFLAMLFIWRLKLANPNVQGKQGSEYRLLTVALMLGNKCESFSSLEPS